MIARLTDVCGKGRLSMSAIQVDLGDGNEWKRVGHMLKLCTQPPHCSSEASYVKLTLR